MTNKWKDNKSSWIERCQQKYHQILFLYLDKPINLWKNKLRLARETLKKNSEEELGLSNNKPYYIGSIIKIA